MVDTCAGNIEKRGLARDNDFGMPSVNAGYSFFMIQGAFFFKPVKFRVSLSADLVETLYQFILFSVLGISLIAKERMDVGKDVFLPEADLRGMRLVLTRYLIGRIYFLDHLNGGLRLLMG